MFKKAARNLLPPIITNGLTKRGPGFGFSGDYPDWRAAQADSSGYDAPLIFSKVRASILAVKEGRAVFERDSVLFDKPDHSWILLTSLFRVAAEREGRLRVLDFGGSLGSTYFQCRDMLAGLKNVEWSVVEQRHFVDEGRRTFEDGMLKFYYDIEACLVERHPDLLLVSGVLAYLPDPYTFIGEFLHHNVEYILVDKTRVIPGERDRLTVQKVHPQIYEAAYPAWFFSETRLLSAFAGHYRLVGETGTHESAGVESEVKGFLFQRIENT